MAMGQLGRIAQRIRRHSGHALVIHLGRGLPGQNHLIAQVCQQGKPEWIVLVHIQYPWQANGAPLGIFQWLVVVEKPIVFEFINILYRCLFLLLACSPFAAVAGKVSPSIREVLHRNLAGIAAATAAEGFAGNSKALQLLCWQDARMLLAGFQGKDGCTISSHQTSNVRTDNILMEQQLHGTKHCIIVEGTTLYHDIGPQGIYILQLHNLEQGIFDNRKGNAGRNIPYLGTILLSLLYLGIHKDGTAGAQIHRSLRGQCLCRKFPSGHFQALGKVLNKGTATSRAGLIEDNTTDISLVYIKALHILAANIQHKGYIRTKFLCRTKVGKGFYLTIIGMKCCLHNGLTIACGKYRSYVGIRIHGSVKLLQLLDNGLERGAMIAAIGCIKQFLIFANNSQLGGSRTGINAYINRTTISRKLSLWHLVLVMAGLKFLIGCLIFKQHKICLPLLFSHSLIGFLNAFLDFFHGNRPCLLRHGCTNSYKVIAVLNLYNMFLVQLQGFNKPLLQLRQEVERPA